MLLTFRLHNRNFILRNCFPLLIKEGSRKLSELNSKTVTDGEDFVLPSLKKIFNRTNASMQMPIMTRKYANSKAPLIPNFFLGKLQLELFEYPELSTKEEVDSTKSMSDQLEQFISSIDSADIDRQAAIPDDVIRSCQQIGIFGQRLDPEFGGLGLNAIESVRLAESMGLDGSLFTTITAHEALGMKGIILAGTEEQKRKYLPSMATGQTIGAFCLAEASSGVDPQQVQSSATLSADAKSYILNGHKLWVTNASRANLFTVIAKTSVKNEMNESEDRLTALLVDRQSSGVQVSTPVEHFGLCGLDLADVFFSNVSVPIENILGEPGAGLELATRITGAERYLVGGFCVGLLRNVMDAMIEHCLLRHQFGRPIAQFEMVQEHLSRAAAHLYAVESLTYLIAGFLTEQPSRDLRIESAAVKVFATETAKYILADCLPIFGAFGLTKQIPIERYLRDSYVLSSFMGSNDLLRLYIAGAGLSYAGKELTEFVQKTSQPTKNLRYVLSKMFMKDVRLLMSAPAVVSTSQLENERGAKVSHQLRNHLHHNFEKDADRLSRIVYRTHEMTRQAMILHGPNLIEHQNTLRCLADLAIDTLAVSACLSRASRAKSIGVRYQDHEAELARAFMEEAFLRMEQIIDKYKTKESLSKRISAVLYKENKYAASHPLTRVW